MSQCNGWLIRLVRVSNIDHENGFPAEEFLLLSFLCVEAGTAQSVKRLATGWTTERSNFESRYGQEFLLLRVVQTGSGVHPTSYTMGTGGSFPGVKRPGHEAHHSPATTAKVKKMWIYVATSPYAFMT
jgi:hypothetical protein